MSGLKIVTVLVALALATTAFFYMSQKTQHSEVPTPVREAFKEWRLAYGKSYGTSQDLEFRTKVFYQNFLKVKEMSKQAKSYTVGLNKFSDMTEEEFVAKYTGYNPSTSRLLEKNKRVGADELGKPAKKVDWRRRGAVNPIKNQGRCGSCWAFATVHSIEAAHAIKSGELLDLSEQQLVDCAGGIWFNHGCNGGLPSFAFRYIRHAGGLTKQSEYPYNAKDGSCQHPKDLYAKLDTWVNVKSDVESVEAAVTQQPLAIAIHANPIMHYTSGIFEDQHCGTQLNHAVGLDGYGSQGGQDYWIVRNSWGTDWGEDGYIRMAKGTGARGGTCGLLMETSFPVMA